MMTFDDVIKIIRCQLIPYKHGLTIQQIENEYMESTGQSIPFRDFGCTSSQQLLEKSNEFQFRQTLNGKVFTTKPKSESVHISKFVQEQGNRANSAHSRSNMQSNTRRIVSDAVAQNEELQSIFTSHRKNNAIPKKDEVKPKMTTGLVQRFQQVNIVDDHGTDALKKSVRNSSNARSTPTMQTNFHRIVSEAVFQNEKAEAMNRPRRENAIEVVEISSDKATIESVDPVDDKPRPKCVKHEEPSEAISKSIGNRIRTSSTSVQSRLQIPKILDDTIDSPISASQGSQPKPIQLDKNANELMNVNDVKQTRTVQAAKMLSDGEQTSLHPMCTDSSDEIARKIYLCVADNGVPLDDLLSLFEHKYNLSLPDYWKLIVLHSTELFEVELDENHNEIVRRVPPKCINERYFKRQTNIVQQEVHTGHKPNLLAFTLPANVNISLPVHISAVCSTDKVWAFLIGSAEWFKLQEVLNVLEKDLAAGRKQNIIAENIQIGEYYYTIHRKNCRRVCVMEKGTRGRKALCLFIDYADEHWVDFDNLYEIDPSILQFQHQALCLSLSNLQQYSDDRVVTDLANDYLCDKSFVAEVKKVTADRNILKFEAIFLAGPANSPIRMNELILSKHTKYLTEPKLKVDELMDVYVTNISEFGNIYCILKENAQDTSGFIKRMISKIVRKGIDESHRAIVGKYSPNDIYLVYDSNSMQWYRASYLCQLSFLLIDCGFVRVISAEHVYRLASLSAALLKYPAQAFKVQLNGSKLVVPKTHEYLQKLRSLQPQFKAQLQLLDSSQNIPLVNMFIHVTKDSNKTFEMVNVTHLAELECGKGSGSFNIQE